MHVETSPSIIFTDLHQERRQVPVEDVRNVWAAWEFVRAAHEYVPREPNDGSTFGLSTNKIYLIKTVRTLTKWGLKDSKDFVEVLLEEFRDPFEEPAKNPFPL